MGDGRGGGCNGKHSKSRVAYRGWAGILMEYLIFKYMNLQYQERFIHVAHPRSLLQHLAEATNDKLERSRDEEKEEVAARLRPRKAGGCGGAKYFGGLNNG